MERRRGIREMRIVHVRSDWPASMDDSGLRRDEEWTAWDDVDPTASAPPLGSRFRGNDVEDRGSDVDERWDGVVGATKFGMLRLTFGRLAERSNACEVSMPSEWTGVVNSNNGDQEV